MVATTLATQTEDVAVDARGNIHINDKQRGLFISAMTAPGLKARCKFRSIPIVMARGAIFVRDFRPGFEPA